MSSGFDAERAAFRLLADALLNDREIAADVEKAFGLLLTRYSTKIFENRFIVGGVAERIIAAVYVALGQRAKMIGVEVTRTDISVGGAVLSVKGAFQGRTSTIRLVNVMGDSTQAEWNEATLFVLSGTGIGYADPALLPGATVRRKDVVELPMRHLCGLWVSDPSLLVPLPIPVALQDADASDVASRIVADEILRYTRRLKPFDLRSPRD